jgi:uncharacterized protein YndB with AHSA1/START domain
MPATYTGGALRFERRYPHPVEKVWRAVSEPAELAHWFPCSVSYDELRVGAPLRFVFPDEVGAMEMDGEVTALEPPRLLAFTWGPDELRFELEPDGEDGTVLRFSDVLEAADKAARDAAGWEVCLARFEQRLAGEAAEPPDWRAFYESYERLGFPTGAPVPD